MLILQSSLLKYTLLFFELEIKQFPGKIACQFSILYLIIYHIKEYF